MTWPDVATHLSPSVVESFEKDMYYVHRQKIYDSIFLVPSPAVFWMSHFLFMSSFLEDRICTMGYPYFQNNAKNYSFTVFAQIRGRWLIKILGFYGGGLLQFLPKNAKKSLKNGTFGPKKW